MVWPSQLIGYGVLQRVVAIVVATMPQPVQGQPPFSCSMLAQVTRQNLHILVPATLAKQAPVPNSANYDGKCRCACMTAPCHLEKKTQCNVCNVRIKSQNCEPLDYPEKRDTAVKVGHGTIRSL